MNYPVVKGAAYALVQANSMLLYQGSTQITERLKNEQSEHLKALPEHLRSFEDAEMCIRDSDRSLCRRKVSGRRGNI